jgi:hypothetical protein
MKYRRTILAAFLILMQLCCSSLFAGPTTANQAESVVKGWLRADARPLGADLGRQVGKVETFTNVEGEPIYYVVYLEPSGFVIVAADDLVEPIIGFANDGTYDPSPQNPLGALVARDLKERIAAARDTQILELTGATERALEAEAKWAQLENFASGPSVLGLTSISDVRVAPLVESKWDQTTCCATVPDPNALACYNYYTPPFDTPDGNSHNYPCGCIATAMAQLIRYHQFPTLGIGIQTFTVRVTGVNYDVNTLGGDGNGGPYNWGLMDLVPDCNTTTAQRQAIGALCYDAGLSVNMNYLPTGSWAWIGNMKSIVPTFGYSNAMFAYNGGRNIGPPLNDMVNPNLDYNHPVMLNIANGEAVPHMVLADGYGYNAATLYHHINMGWSGTDDAWYNLPIVDTLAGTYDIVDGCLYNIFTSGTGEIISGRVTNSAGTAISGAAVTAQGPGGPYNTVTNSNGIYALAKLPSAGSFTLSATKTGYIFPSQIVTTGTSVQDANTSGNRWNINFHPAKVNIYVDADANGANNGSSWTDAYNSLQDALSDAKADPNVEKIWVAEGTYKPGTSRTDTFNLISGVAIYGGFSGVETDISERNWSKHVTILSGDIGITGNNSDNSYHVVRGYYVDNTAVIDGFTITGGRADAYNPNDRGPGMYNDHGDAIVNNCIFIANSANHSGGGMYNLLSSDPTVTNCTFISNSTKYGAGMFNDNGCNPTITNCIFWNNSAIDRGGAIWNYNSSPTVTNSILWANTAPDGPQIYSHGGTTTVSNCDVQGGQAAVYITGGGTLNWGPGNINTDPIFADADLRLSPNSPCIDAGDNTAVPPDVTDLDGDGDTTEQTPLDLDKHHRVEDGDCNGTYFVDMGAYEFAWIYLGDLDGDCDIDFNDFGVMAGHWMMGK